ncbi:FAD-binding oxidoreductase [Nonomuraea sp. K274]|uniref:FAD-binding oxidoreductase n=1 Tax=Nonomuraea cypriaca TaxID=1187855 RepID=A0A931A525_9ACTN|nr:FAD-binding oxidoreductase [Nonomuraea cypriaca]MBF8185278.1 FAD-binding oxidoreductase [Nonomuraea cypriaca]
MVHHSGAKIGPDDPRYDPLRRGFNPRWLAARPDYIRLPRSGDEVARALQEALDEPALPERSRITVRSGGHCYEDFVCSPDVRVIIDLSLMDGVHADETTGDVCMEAGVTIGQLYKKLYQATGRALPGGSCPSVGLGGHVAGGGFGLLSRQYGLTVDYLHAVEVAVVNGSGRVELVTATRDDADPDLKDLWWAHTGGGGGNFGIVTRMWFRDLPQAPKRVLLATGGWKWADIDESRFRQIVGNFGAFFEQHQGGPGDEYADLFAILLLSHPSSSQIGLIAQIDAEVPDAEELIRNFEREINQGVGQVLHPLTEALGEYAAFAVSEAFGERAAATTDERLGRAREIPTLPWTVVSKVVGAPTPNNRAGKHKSAYMRRPLPRNQVTALWRGLTEDSKTPRDAVVQIDSYGSAVNRVRPEETAVAQRDSIMKLQHQVYWPADQDGTDHLRWIRTLYRNMYPGGVPVPDETTDGCFINYPDIDLSDPAWNTSGVPWSTLYYGGNYPRLRRAKRRWDPRNVFRHGQSIEP